MQDKVHGGGQRQRKERGLRSRWRENRISGKFRLPRIHYQHQRQKCTGNQQAAGDGSGSRTWCLWKSRGMSLGLKLRFLRTTAFPIAIYGCEPWTTTRLVATRSVLMLSNCCVIEDCLWCHGRRGKRTNGCWRRMGLFWRWERVWRRGRWGYLATSSGQTVWRTDWGKRIWKASGEGADQQRPVSRIWKNGRSWTLLLQHNWRTIGKDGEKSSKSQRRR